MKKMKGVIVAMTTPFAQDGSVMLEEVGRNAEWLVQKGVHCLYPCGTTGEMLNMSLDERKTIAERVVKAAAGSSTDVFIQVGSMTTADTVELAQHAKAIGADGIGVVTPAFFGLNADELVEHFTTVAKSVGGDFPVYLYGIPQCASNDLTAAVVCRIHEACPNVLGIKYSYNDPNRISEFLRIGNYDFSVLVGLEKHFLGYLALGCDGVVSGCSNAFPELFLALYDAWEKKDMEEALRLQRVEEKLSNLIDLGQGNARVKAAQRFRGLEGGHMKRPSLDLSGEALTAFEAELQQFMPESWK